MVLSRRRRSAIVNSYADQIRAQEYKIRQSLCRRNKSVGTPSTSMPNITMGALDFGLRKGSIQNEVYKFCQGKKCRELSEENLAVKICHHTDCQDKNNMAPLLLCAECDKDVHVGNATSHLRFEIPARMFKRTPSVKSQNSDSGTEEDGENRFDKKNRGYASARRFFNMSSAAKKKVRRPANEVPSKEIITINFYDSATDEYDTETIPAVKGRSLKESVGMMFDMRKLSFNTHSIFLEASHTPLPLAFETFPLGGNQLHVRANQDVKVDERIIAFARQEGSKEAKRDTVTTPNARVKKNILAYLGETDANSNSYQLSTAPLPGRRRSGANRQQQKEYARTLQDLLAYYTVYGLEEEEIMPEDDDNGFFHMETSWTLVIDQDEGITKKQRDQQEAIWELLSTESAYIEKLRAIVQVFLVCLKNVQAEGYLTEIDPVKLFGNIEEVYEANVQFWTLFLRPILEEARNTRRPLSPVDLSYAFQNFSKLFDPYVEYCLEEPACLQYHKSKKKVSHFKEYLQWCENHKLCHRLKLSDLLVKPMQRVTKYPLLLKAILRKTQDETDTAMLNQMVEEVEKFVAKINNTLRQRHEQQKLDEVVSRLDAYVPVESVNEEMEKILLEHCSLNLRGRIPGLKDEAHRCVLLEGPLKIVEKQGRMDVYGFLFTDIFLLTKPKRGNEKCKIIKQPFRLDKVVLYPMLKDPGCFLFVYLNEYDVLVNAFVIQTSIPEQNKWIQAVEKAKQLYKAARAGNASPLDFFDEDLPLPVPSLNSPHHSPLPQRRHTTSVEPNRDGLYYEAHMTHGRHLRGDTQPTSSPDLLMAYKRNRFTKVTRSISDPKERNGNQLLYPSHPLVQSRSGGSSGKWNENKNRFSVINEGAHDTRSWVLTTDKRSRSDSLATSESVACAKSNKVLTSDSFRSVKSDTGLSRSSSISDSEAGSVFVKPSASAPNVSNLGVIDARTVLSNSGDTMSASNCSGVLSDASSTSSASIHADARSVSTHNLYSVSDAPNEKPYLEPIMIGGQPLTGMRRASLSALHSTPEERVLLFEAMQQSDRLKVSCVDDETEKTPVKTFTHQNTQTIAENRSFTDAESQCDVERRSDHSDDIYKELPTTAIDAMTQTETYNDDEDDSDCEDFDHICLTRSCSDNILNCSMSHGKEHNMYFTADKSSLKHSMSESNLPTGSSKIVHSRSFSDIGDNRIANSRRRATVTGSPGMRALEVLSMSLESSLKSKQKSTSTTRKHRRRFGLDSKQIEKKKSLRRIALLKRSPVPQRRNKPSSKETESSVNPVSIHDIERIERQLKTDVLPKPKATLHPSYSVSVTASRVQEIPHKNHSNVSKTRSIEFNGRIISADTIEQIKAQMQLEDTLMYGEPEFV